LEDEGENEDKATVVGSRIVSLKSFNQTQRNAQDSKLELFRWVIMDFLVFSTLQQFMYSTYMITNYNILHVTDLMPDWFSKMYAAMHKIRTNVTSIY
jgi:hypothetical protein